MTRMDQPSLNTLVTTVSQSVKLLEEIKGLFVVHEKSMAERNLDAIDTNNEALANALMQLNENFRQRIELQSHLVPELTEANWDAFMMQLPDSEREPLETLWAQLDESLKEVQRLSLVNQQIVRRGQQQVDQLVSILQGKGSSQKIYDNRGASGHVNSQNTLGKA